MSKFERVDWNQLVNDEDDSDVCGDDTFNSEGTGGGGDDGSSDSSQTPDDGGDGNSGLIVEYPLSSPDPSHSPPEVMDMTPKNRRVTTAMKSVARNDDDDDEDDALDDVLELYCPDTCDIDCCNSEFVRSKAPSSPAQHGRMTVTHYEEKKKNNNNLCDGLTGDGDRSTRRRHVVRKNIMNDNVPRTYKRPSQRARRQRRKERIHGVLDAEFATETETTAPPRIRRHYGGGGAPSTDCPTVHRPLVLAGVRRWTVRSVRNGYERLVYDICDSNECPNVVFAALCFLQHDVYTMVLRNCAGKRHYWYDKTTRRGLASDGTVVSGDFERAMRWRANTVGRVSTSPGYDLATFLLQNVTTDKRYDPSRPLILVTTDSMLIDPALYRQLLCTNGRTAASSFSSSSSSSTRLHPSSSRSDQNGTGCGGRCCVCHAQASVVTSDNASVAMPACWRHAGTYLAAASADRTHVCNTVVVDMQFLREEDSPDGEIVCRLRLVWNSGVSSGGRCDRIASPCVLTVAELVLLPFDSHHAELDVPPPTTTTSAVREVDLETAHVVVCQDNHYNDEDLFPSMPIAGGTSAGGRNGGSVRYYDTTIGRVVDKIHCITCTFQR